jgi:benzoyl-CoA reductase/2-hydroxyglutaryl-CoA dehydratase subunit BcrC/BadD/HgdB
MGNHRFVGFACAYTPLALIHAAGFTPCRILPNEDCPDQAGRLLHDNLCPHIKLILDRAMSRRIPDLHGMIFMNSCDAMRRLYDAWQAAMPDVRAVLVDLPATASPDAIAFFRDELQRLAGVLENWAGEAINPDRINDSLHLYNRLGELFARLRETVRNGGMKNGPAVLQAACNAASCEPPETAIMRLETLPAESDGHPGGDGVPVFLFGNMMPDPEAFALFEECGARIMGEDLCTGSRLFKKIDPAAHKDLFLCLADGLLRQQPCARTFDPARPGRLAHDIVDSVRRHQAKGVIGYTVKFCDPYLARLPNIRDALKKESIPFLFLEGDCTIRSMGQQKTRIEAFIEMLR